MTRVVCITGSREGWPRPVEIIGIVNACDVLYVGCATGVDEIARNAMRARGMRPEVFYADWLRYGRRKAGPERNERMVSALRTLQLVHPEWQFACHAFPGPHSRGTWNCLRWMRKHGFAAEVHRWYR